MDYTTPSLWDFTRSPSAFPQIQDNDFLALLQKQFNTESTSPPTTYPISHDGVDPSKISNLPAPAPAPPTPLSDESSPSPPSTTDHVSSSRRHSTNSTTEQDGHELKRKASPDDMMDEESPSQKSCSSRFSQCSHAPTLTVRRFCQPKSPLPAESQERLR